MPDSRPTLTQLADRVDQLDTELATLREGVDRLATAVTELLRGPGPSVAWLQLEDLDRAGELLEDLQAWIAQVWTAYPGAELAPCWTEHPTVIEELLAVRRAHAEVYGRRGSGQSQVLWHQQARPGAAARVQAMLGGPKGCSEHPQCMFDVA